MTTQPAPIKFRPHHFLCTLSFIGEGYSPDFIKNYQKIVAQLNANPLQPIEVTRQLDDICTACPLQPNGICLSAKITNALDDQHAAILHLQPGEIINWTEAKKRLQQHMTLEKFHQACALCEWKKLGVCESKLQALKDSF